MNRREFTQLLAIASAANLLPSTAFSNHSESTPEGMYNLPKFGNARLLHITDSHAQLLPVYFREPSINIGINREDGKPPHIVGKPFLDYFNMTAGTAQAHAFTSLDFVSCAKRYGKVGGYAYLSTLVKQLRQSYGPDDHSLLLDGGDTWQGSATAYWTRGKDMVEASNILGVDVMTGHWEFTYQDTEVLENIEAFNGEFIAQNVKVNEDALFEGSPAYDEDTGHAFKPYVIKPMGEHRVAIIGQAFPYTPIANPKRFIPDWTFGIQSGELQQLIDEHRRDHPKMNDFQTENHLGANLVELLFAGYNTVVNTMTTAIYLLTVNPDKFAKARAEIDQVVGSKPVASFAELESCTYLDQVMDETLRLYSPTPAIGRKLTKDTQLGEILCPAGTEVMMPMCAVHRDPVYWKDPDSFVPERFGDGERIQRCSWMPFSDGPRRCLGQHYARVLFKAALVQHLKHFDFELAPGHRFKTGFNGFGAMVWDDRTNSSSMPVRIKKRQA